MTYSRASHDFGDCVAVVTGGHGGIGAAISAMAFVVGAGVLSGRQPQAWGSRQILVGPRL